MNAFEHSLLDYFSRDKLTIIQKVKIGIAGAGGLGSNLAVSLARTGFRNFEIIDFDVVETKNLNRQYYFLDEVGKRKVVALHARLKKINPDIAMKSFCVRLTDKNITNYFQDRDVIFEAFDNVPSKKNFLETFGNSGKLLVLSNGMAGVSNRAEIKVRQLNEKVYLVGDGVTCVGKKNPPLAPRVGICSSLMAQIALEAAITGAIKID